MIYPEHIYKEFYQENIPGPHGLTFDQSLDFLEQDNRGRHDYFQWLFPTDQESRFNKAAPLYTPELKKYYPEEKMLHALKAYRVYLGGLKSWPSPTDHNNLRLSRVLRHLFLSGQSAALEDLYISLIKIHLATKKLTLNNMDHFRAAAMDHRFFVIGNEDECAELASFVNNLLPGSKIIPISSTDILGIQKLHEPVLQIKRWGFTKLRLHLLKDRGCLSKVALKDTDVLERYFLHYRYWY